jgi:phosphoribosylformimino-5-aminoimidazole carboxamide ribotide isomerase
MRIIGVIDLAGGRAVHARGGRRECYAPVAAAAGSEVNGDALALARAYRSHGIAEIYLADLDAISNGMPPHGVVASVAALGIPLWLDAGVSSVAALEAALAAGAARVIVGLETLSSCEALDAMCDAAAGSLAFSLDLRDGVPMAFAEMPIEAIARRVVTAGVAAMTVIDVARVGTGRGPDLETIGRVRAAAPELLLVAGGGVRGPEDLTRLAAAGCDGALVATALHDGRLTAQDVAGAQGRQRIVSR